MNNPAKTPLNRVRATLFDLVRERAIPDTAALELLRVAELVIPTEDNATAGELDGALGIHIRDESGDGTTWRAYPSESTTIEELSRACQTFGLRTWVDLDGKVCLITLDGPGSQRPSAAELAGALYGAQDPDVVPLFLRRQAE